MKKISELTEDNSTKTYFYYLGAISGNRKASYKTVIGNYSAEFLPSPMKFGDKPKEDYTLPGKDSHYDETSHRWLADKLYEQIDPEI